MPAVFVDLNPATHPVVVSPRPPHLTPVAEDPAALRLVPARHVAHGDLVVGVAAVTSLGKGIHRVSHFPSPFTAEPAPLRADCMCGPCQDVRSFTWDVDRPLRLGTIHLRPRGYWVCGVSPSADRLTLIIPALWRARPAA
ncbi:hypothetical protein ACFYZ9_33695 [Streptomyces sp. NPDC001691]|uniref:hypothetical protein n=1 Tax=Streptomyces sp. NPDC001691 TaxID=3364600 RepID=UPI003693AECE